MKKTDKKLLDTIPFYHFKTVKGFQNFLQKKYRSNGTIDYIDIGGILYTMSEYDMSGKIISYYNHRTGLGFDVITGNRYRDGFTDAYIEEPYEVGYYRNDITFID